jgi:hypothetical protein
MLAVELFGLAARCDIVAVKQCMDLIYADQWPVQPRRKGSPR